MGVDTPRATALLFAKLSDSGKRNVQMIVKLPIGYKQTQKSALNVNRLLKRMVVASRSIFGDFRGIKLIKIAT